MAYRDVVLADAPVGYWRLEEAVGAQAADVSGNGRMGNYSGGYTLDQPGAPGTGKAVLLNGTNGFIWVPHNAAFDLTGNLTLEVWVYPTSRANYRMLVTKLTGNGTTISTFQWYLNTADGVPAFQQVTGTGNQTANGTTGPPLNQWSHLAVVKTGVTVTHYLNGVANGSGPINGVVTTNTLPLVIGTRDDSFGPFAGRLDEVAIYATALPLARVQAHQASGLSAGFAGQPFAGEPFAGQPFAGEPFAGQN